MRARYGFAVAMLALSGAGVAYLAVSAVRDRTDRSVLGPAATRGAPEDTRPESPVPPRAVVDDARADGAPPPRSRLRVTSRATGAELRAVEVRALPFEPDLPRLPPPGAAAPAVVRADSPVVLPAAGPRFRTCWVRAPEHAWARVDVDTSARAEHAVALAPGGHLGVFVHAASGLEGLRLALRDRSGEPWLELACEPFVELESLPAGTWEVALLRAAPPRELDAVRVEVPAGAQAVATLFADGPARAAAVPVAGRIELPHAWDLESPGLELVALGTSGSRLAVPGRAMRATPALGATHHRWSGSVATPGDYWMGLIDLPVGRYVTVPPEGDRDLVLEVPPPARLAVLVTDADTGAQVLTGPLHWSVDTAGEAPPMRHGRFEPDPRTGLFEARVPRADLVVTRAGPDYLIEERLTVDGPAATREIRAVHGCGVDVVLTRAGVVCPWQIGWVAFAEGPGSTEMWEYRDDRLRLWLSAPGPHALTVRGLPELDGFERLVDVPPRTFVEERIELASAP